MADLLETALTGSTLILDTTIGSITIDLTPGDPNGPPSPLLSALKPSVRLVKNGKTIVTEAPFGEPESHALGWALLALSVASTVGMVLLIRNL